MVEKQSTANEMLEGESSTDRAIKREKAKPKPATAAPVAEGLKHIKLLTNARTVVGGKPRYRGDQFELNTKDADVLIAKRHAIEVPKLG